MRKTNDNARGIFESGYFCAESVLKVIAEEEGIPPEPLIRMATGFGAGMSRTCNACGALTGGVLALNLVFGRVSHDESPEANIQAVQRRVNEFEKEFGTGNCQALLDCDLSTDAGRQQFNDLGLREQCAVYTGRAAEIVRLIIEDFRNPSNKGYEA